MQELNSLPLSLFNHVATKLSTLQPMKLDLMILNESTKVHEVVSGDLASQDQLCLPQNDHAIVEMPEGGPFEEEGFSKGSMLLPLLRV